eukprot:CAMPEP_0174703588 /NCGR_PEP_ID=MMETSP1094-20130205/7477_1 /TAXON_ID=156173 /ORGANISM="Chrysochromulina brevifilum, Strain UTEX LB 985" /LENGTH=347 /DNA_ID=CAMNT_0015901531 /DNA_START=644 /DNA_END=1687 /DNA_ORIENTATION=+
MPGGPGWISDILDAKLEFEESSYTLMKDKEGHEFKAFDGKGEISGKLLIAAPEGREIGHNGVEVTFQTNVIVPDIAVTPEAVMNKTWTLLEPGSISGDAAIEVGFDIQLLDKKAMSVLRNTFFGTTMQVRHSLSFRIVRPWYTFSVRGTEDIAIYNAAIPDTAPPEPTETALRVEDFGGLAVFDHGKCTFSAGGRIVGTIAFSNFSGGSVAKVEVIVGRAEQLKTNKLWEHKCRVYEIHSSSHAPIEDDRTLSVDIGLAETGSEEDPHVGPLPPSMVPLVPEDEGCNKALCVGVEYWIRLLITCTAPAGSKDPPRQCWATHPINLLPVERDVVSTAAGTEASVERSV